MFSKNIAVKCPYCGAGFSIPVGARYKSAEAIAIDKGRNFLVKTQYAQTRDATAIFLFTIHNSLSN